MNTDSAGAPGGGSDRATRAFRFRPALFIALTAFLVGLVCCWFLPVGSPVKVTVSGQDALHAGAATIALHGGAHKLAVTCGATCPELVDQFNMPEGSVLIEIRDGSGKCILCEDWYVTSPKSDLRVSGHEKLSITEIFDPEY